MPDNRGNYEMDVQSFLKLTHLYTAFRQRLDIKDIERILQNTGNINCRFLPDSYLKSHHPELVGSTILHFATSLRDLDLNILELLLNYGADSTLKNDKGSTPLFQVIRQEFTSQKWNGGLANTRVAKMLSWQVQSRKLVNPYSSDGISHFHVACMTNHQEAVSFFLKGGSPVDRAVSMSAIYFPGYTALHFAVKFCAVETIEILLRFHAKLDIQDARGLTPIHVAIEQKIEILKLMNLGQFYHDRCSLTDSRIYDRIMQQLMENSNHIDSIGLTHFHITCMLEDASIVEKCLEQIDDIDHSIKFDSPVWPGYTALHFAALFNVKIVQLLLKNGANIRIKDANGISPFDICLESYELHDIHSVLSNDPILKDIMFSNSKTSLSDFIMGMSEEAIYQEIENMNIFIPVNSPLWPGYTPLHIAVILADRTEVASNYRRCWGIRHDKDDDDVVFEPRCLIKNKYLAGGVNLSAQDANGSTPLHLAFRLMKVRVIERLIDGNRNNIKNSVDSYNLSHLHVAAAVDDAELVAKLLKSGAAIDLQINTIFRDLKRWDLYHRMSVTFDIPRGSTALHIAVAAGSCKAIGALLQYGASVYTREANNMTPIHLQILSENKSHIEQMMLHVPELKDCIAKSCNLSHLHVASFLGDEQAVKKLLDQGADIDAAVKSDGSLRFLAPYEGFTPLHFAFERRKRSVCDLLIDRGADIFAQSTGDVPLLFKGLASRCSPIFNAFFSTLRKNEDLRRRLYEQTGLTMLHVACHALDHRQWCNFEYYNEADVNARSDDASPLWPGCTPLEILIKRYENYNENSETHRDIDTLIELGFLKNGADVAMINGSNMTAVLEAHASIRDHRGKRIPRTRRLSILLQAHKDFNVNPVNEKGISHFHVACLNKYYDVAEKFLKHNVDVNSLISLFSDEFPGCTPLHLAMMDDVDTKLTKLLLDHGADVGAQDVYGNTPLHIAAEYSRDNFEIFHLISEKEADTNARNLAGDTPLDILLNSYQTPETRIAEVLELFLKQGYRVNSYHPRDQEGWIPKALSRCTGRGDKSIYAIICSAPDLFKIDEFGRTSIHNISSYSFSYTHQHACFDDIELIKELSKRGCHVDYQDTIGRSALHVAVQFANEKIVTELLKLGADINLEDSKGEVPFAYCFETRTLKVLRNSCNSSSFDKHKYKNIIEVFVKHISKLQFAGLDVHVDNLVALEKSDPKIVIDSSRFCEQLEISKQMTIGYHDISFKLHDLLSETKIVAAYPNMLPIERRAIINFFKTGDVHKVCEKLDELHGFFELQFNKAVKRGSLIGDTNKCLNVLVRFTLETRVSKMITQYLSNMDLKNLKASVIKELSGSPN